MVLKRIRVESAAWVGGALYAGFGLVLGAIFGLLALGGAGVGFSGLMGGVLALILLPILHGILGALMAAFAAWLYNIVAGFTGGLEVEVE